MENLLDEFRKQESLLEDFKNMLRGLINDLLETSDIHAHQIIGRVKSIDSLTKKIRNKNGKYSNISDITDCVGLRVISYLEDEVDQIAEIVKNELNIDPKNSVDKRKLEADRFGYKSLHYVVSLKPNRTKLKEYSRYKGLKAEIQIRSILQHAWAEIEHDLGYKSEITVPEFLRRDFFRVAALLETADKTFVSIKSSINEYTARIEANLETNPSEFLIDKDTLTKYIRKSELINEINDSISKGTSLPIEGTDGDLDYVIAALNKYGIRSIKELDSMIKSYKAEIIPFSIMEMETNPMTFTGTFTAPAIHAFTAVLLLKKGVNDPEVFDEEELSYKRAKSIFEKISK